MKKVTINITNLIGTMVMIGDKESASAQIQENVNDALLKVLKSASETTTDSSTAELYNSSIIKNINQDRQDALENLGALMNAPLESCKAQADTACQDQENLT